ncbi:HNH endonuclease [Microbacterium resistens]|uniref:HNH endonuclease n=1 Tax=Microbacterium resistens TaxID=156977 RepID=A0ABY3RX56_9MICO|nr:HNH endonuclease [Microbacterium resistens]
MFTTAPSSTARSREGLLDAWVATRRQIARLEAEASALLAERVTLFEGDVRAQPVHRDSIRRSMIAEYAAAGRVSRGTVERAFADAEVLAAQLPDVKERWPEGTITAAHVREIVHASRILRDAIVSGSADPEVLTLYQAAVLEVAEHESPARTRVLARQVAAALAPAAVVERHRAAWPDRCVTIRSLDDGLALITAVIPEVYAVAIMDRLTRMTHHIRRRPAPDTTSGNETDTRDVINADTTDAAEALDLTVPSGPDTADVAEPTGTADTADVVDGRTADQVRADLFTDLLLAADPTPVHGTGLDRIQAHIQVTVAATTLAGHDDRPAELDDHGPLHPDLARALAGRHTGWTRLFLGPDGILTHTDTYTPTIPMRRHLRARDQHCRFPGCTTPAHHCDIDHTHDHARGGPTTLTNLAHLCPTHHTLKPPDIPDAHRWTARQHPDGTIQWTSPLQRTYAHPPPRRIMFL